MAIHRDRRYDSDIMCQQLQRTSEDIGEKRMTEQENGCRLIALLRADIGNYEKNRRIYAIDHACPSITVFSSHIPRILIEDHNDPETQTENE